MPRRSKKSDGAIGWLALIIGAIVILVKIILVLLPFILIGGGVYYYFKWQNKKLAEYDNDWKLFYHNELKRKLKIVAIVVPISIGIGYVGYSNHQEQEKERIEREQAEAERLRIEKEKIRLELKVTKDSSQLYLDLGLKDFERKRYKQSIVNLDSALLIFPENYEAQFKKGIALKERRKYQDAIDVLDDLSRKTSQYKSEIHLIKGQCFLKLKKKENAIVQVYESAELGNEEAQKLYDKINPIIKEITGYITRCCDGSTSYSSGRGACSHHGGVCKRNEPIYRERRKYQKVNK